MLWAGLAILLHGIVLVTLLSGYEEEIKHNQPIPIQVSLVSSPTPQISRVAPQTAKIPAPVIQKQKSTPTSKSVVVPHVVPHSPAQNSTPEPKQSPQAPQTPASVHALSEQSVQEASPHEATSNLSDPNAGGGSGQTNSGETHEQIVAAQFDADYLKNPAPVYPSLSRRMGEEGKVILRAYVLPDGRPEKVEIKTGSGSTRLDTAALTTVRTWRFVPARKGTQAIAAWVLIPIHFRLES